MGSFSCEAISKGRGKKTEGGGRNEWRRRKVEQELEAWDVTQLGKIRERTKEVLRPFLLLSFSSACHASRLHSLPPPSQALLAATTAHLLTGKCPSDNAATYFPSLAPLPHLPCPSLTCHLPVTTPAHGSSSTSLLCSSASTTN